MTDKMTAILTIAQIEALRDAVLIVEDLINMPSQSLRDEPHDVREYRHRLYPVWSPVARDHAAMAATAIAALTRLATAEANNAKACAALVSIRDNAPMGTHAYIIANAAIGRLK